AGWLLWVLSQQGGAVDLGRLLVAGIVTAFAAWLFGIGQRRSDSKVRFTLMGLALAGWIGSFVAVTALPYAAPPVATKHEAAIPSEAWSPKRLAELRAQGKPVFVNFTAAWCVTCQVNEQVALSTAEVADAFARTGTVYLKADWTNRDATIARELAAHGRAGVPLYLYYPPSGAEPRVLPQLLTPGLVVEALESGRGQ
ncbi:MAG: thioredoxin family protein, partial [Ignavibacteriales bacterium]